MLFSFSQLPWVRKKNNGYAIIRLMKDLVQRMASGIAVKLALDYFLKAFKMSARYS